MSERAISWAPLLLADPSPCLRLLVLGELLGRAPDDPEMGELRGLRDGDPLLADLLSAQHTDGSWTADGRMWQGGPLRATSLALMRLGYLGLGPEHPAVRRGAEYLFTCQQADGAWPIPGSDAEPDARDGYDVIPLQTAFPLRALA
ncbi:MAG: hypothetical protein JXA09_16785, partial [Anaerolineae bacterium]|nr:hypothetical protein [Anaerolineae bacterium]